VDKEAESNRTENRRLAALEIDQSKSYSTWEQVAGYFDGDGSVSVFVWKYVVSFYPDWSDQSRGQLEQIAAFSARQGIRVGYVRKMTRSAAHVMRISEQESVMQTSERLAPLCFKKRSELITVLEYRKLDLISGSEVQERFEGFVELGMRERHGNRRLAPVPWSYTEGYRISRKSIALLGHMPRLELSEAQRREALERHNVFGESISVLSKSYGLSRSAMWRLLKKSE
jgi:hypothetical protein